MNSIITERDKILRKNLADLLKLKHSKFNILKIVFIIVFRHDYLPLFL